jgi:hypothetical protein
MLEKRKKILAREIKILSISVFAIISIGLITYCGSMVNNSIIESKLTKIEFDLNDTNKKIDSLERIFRLNQYSKEKFIEDYLTLRNNENIKIGPWHFYLDENELWDYFVKLHQEGIDSMEAFWKNSLTDKGRKSFENLGYSYKIIHKRIGTNYSNIKKFDSTIQSQKAYIIKLHSDRKNLYSKRTNDSWVISVIQYISLFTFLILYPIRYLYISYKWSNKVLKE